MALTAAPPRTRQEKLPEAPEVTDAGTLSKRAHTGVTRKVERQPEGGAGPREGAGVIRGGELHLAAGGAVDDRDGDDLHAQAGLARLQRPRGLRRRQRHQQGVDLDEPLLLVEHGLGPRRAAGEAEEERRREPGRAHRGALARPARNCPAASKPA